MMGAPDDRTTCPACGAAMEPDAQKCPRCNWSRQELRRFRQEFWGSLIIFAFVFALAFLAISYMARILESR